MTLNSLEKKDKQEQNMFTVVATFVTDTQTLDALNLILWISRHRWGLHSASHSHTDEGGYLVNKHWVNLNAPQWKTASDNSVHILLGLWFIEPADLAAQHWQHQSQSNWEVFDFYLPGVFSLLLHTDATRWRHYINNEVLDPWLCNQ